LKWIQQNAFHVAVEKMPRPRLYNRDTCMRPEQHAKTAEMYDRD